MNRNRNYPRRSVIQGAAALAGLSVAGLGGCAGARSGGAGDDVVLGPDGTAHVMRPLAPIRASTDRLYDITVCLRPFRAAGPRLDAEEIGRTRVVHNYGHGGSGWSLSWGSGTIAVKKALENGPKKIAVVGCGALGLTSAILAQEAGAEVTIYARDLLPDTRSFRATGSWTPDSRIALKSAADPKFGEVWEEMARTSFKRYRRYLGLPGNPVAWTDRYICSDISREEAAKLRPADPLGFANYDDRIADITPTYEDLPPGSTPFPTKYVRRASQMMFNIADYAHTLMADFIAAGGKIERREFHAPQEFDTLKEKVVINCPGYAARELMKDESVVPVRGQIGWLVPQPEVNYCVFYEGVNALSRADGIVVQVLGGGEMRGFRDSNETIDRAESEDAVKKLAELYAKFGWAAG
jgi:D-amino-acid oxidase